MGVRDWLGLRQQQPKPEGRGIIVPSHVPVQTLDSGEMMEAFKKAMGDAPASSMFGGGWQGALATRYRTGEARLNALRDAYGGTQDSVSWVFACVSLIASTMAAYPTRFVDLEGETVENPPPDLKMLLEAPNADWTWFDLIEQVVTDLELVGNSYLLKNELNGLGQPKSLYRMRPDRMRIVLAKDGKEAGYVYTPDQALMIPYDLDEIIHFKYPNPLDEHYGMGTVEAIAQTLDQHTAQGLHVTGYFQNGARISGVLTIPETLTDAQFERLKQSWQENYSGPANAFKLLIAEGAADYKAISQTPIASGVVDLMKITKDEILSGFGVPAPLLGGILENANYKMDESQHIFLRAMIPKARRVQEQLTIALTRLWDVDLAIDPHADEPMDVKLAHAKEMMGLGFTVNEIRESVGEPRSEDPAADKILIPNNIIPIDIAGLPPRPGSSIPMEDNSEPGAPPAVGAGTNGQLPAGEGGAEQPSETHPSLADRLADLPAQVQTTRQANGRMAMLGALEAELASMEKELEGLQAKRAVLPAPEPPATTSPDATAKDATGPESEPDQPSWKAPTYPRGFEAIAKAPAREEARAIREHQAQVLRVGVDAFEPAMRKFFRAQRDRVLAAVGQFGPKRVKAKQELTVEAIFNLAKENEEIQKAYLPALDEVGQAALPMPMGLGGGISWDLTSQRIKDLRTGLGDKITRVNQTTKDAVSQQVAEGLRRGYSVTQIANGYPEEDYPGIQGVFSDATDYRAEMIARTESAFAYNGAQVADYKDAGVQAVEILDGEGDEICAEANGSIWTMDDYEADPIGHPNAIFEGSEVLALGGVELGYAAEWRGPAVRLRTARARDQELTVTPNHPVLTGRGWVPARLVREGDYVVCRRSGTPVGRPVHNRLNHVPALVEEVLDALRVAGLVWSAVPSGADLHHDGRYVQGEVDVVVPDRPLTDVPHAPLVEENRELILTGAGVESSSFARPGTLLLRSDRVPLAASSGVPTVLRGSEGDAARSEALGDHASADPKLLADLRGGFALDVELDRVVGVGFDVDRGGHIYDLQTSGRAYFADGILLSNCSRTAVPSDQQPDGSADGSE